MQSTRIAKLKRFQSPATFSVFNRPKVSFQIPNYPSLPIVSHFLILSTTFSIVGDIHHFQSPKVGHGGMHISNVPKFYTFKDCVVQERNTLAAFQANTKVEVVISFLKLLLHSIRIAVEQVGRLPRTDIFCEVDQYPMTSKNSRIIDTWHKL
ncbi:hypothetical protein V6N13_069822 [Hibiscus sabdariffa]